MMRMCLSFAGFATLGIMLSFSVLDFTGSVGAER
jgi:hypothetical protein